MGYPHNPKILFPSDNVISSENVIVYGKSGLVWGFFPPCFATCVTLHLPTLNFTFTSQLLCIRRSFSNPSHKPYLYYLGAI